jgi:hypothetical protein
MKIYLSICMCRVTPELNTLSLNSKCLICKTKFKVFEVEAKQIPLATDLDETFSKTIFEDKQ